MKKRTEALSDPLAESADPPASTRRLKFERGWVIGVVAFTIGRFAIAYGTLDRYGVNIWVFGMIDLVTAVPYGVSTARLASALIDRNFQSVARWGAVASVSFLAPYLYIAWYGKDAGLPRTVYVVLAILVVCFGGNAGYGIRRRVRSGRSVG